LQESLQGMSIIQLFARERREAELFGALNGELRRAQFRSTRFDAFLYAGVEALGSTTAALLLWYGGGQVLTGALTFGGLVAFLEYVGRFFLPIRDLGAKYTVLQAATVSAERIFALLDAEASVRPPAAGARGFETGAPAVEFRHVWFAYQGEEWVLRDCSFEVAPGERVALVGPTGEGKSTIVRLMTRSYDVTRGQVLVGGRDVREWDLTALRRAVGMVPQEVFLFTGTVEENLRVVGGGAVVSREAIARALQAARGDRGVASLAHGLAHEIHERGRNLSPRQVSTRDSTSCSSAPDGRDELPAGGVAAHLGYSAGARGHLRADRGVARVSAARADGGARAPERAVGRAVAPRGERARRHKPP